MPGNNDNKYVQITIVDALFALFDPSVDEVTPTEGSPQQEQIDFVITNIDRLRKAHGVQEEQYLRVNGDGFMVVSRAPGDAKGSIHGPKKLPSLLKQAGNFAGAMSSTVGRALAGKNLRAPPDIIRERDNLCFACEHWISENNRCSKCGCYSAAKNTLAVSTCPVGKWGAYHGS